MQTFNPKTREEWLQLRLHDVTSTEVSALFGVNPYLTHFELWHQKKNQEIIEIDPNERMKWGTHLENAIAKGVAEDNDWKIRRMSEYGRDPLTRMGASFDFEILMVSKRILEIKNLDSLVFKEKWVEEDGEIEAPPHIEFQVQQQLAICGYLDAVIAALIGGNRVVLLYRSANHEIIEELREAVKDFWISIEQDKPPKPDFDRDARMIASLYNHAEPGKVLFGEQVTDEMRELAKKYAMAGKREKVAVSEKKAAKAELLTLIGDVEKIVHPDFSGNFGLRGPVTVEAHERAGYRDFRIYPKASMKEEINV